MRIDDILSNIEIPDDLNAVVQNSICDAEMYRRKRQRYNRIFASSAAAVFVMFTSLIIGQPAWARSIPFIANVFDYVNENLIVKGQFTPYVTNINETVQSNGIGITITEIYCDGENLFISYNINSCESFSDLADTTYMGNQIELDQTILQLLTATACLSAWMISEMDSTFTDNLQMTTIMSVHHHICRRKKLSRKNLRQIYALTRSGSCRTEK